MKAQSYNNLKMKLRFAGKRISLYLFCLMAFLCMVSVSLAQETITVSLDPFNKLTVNNASRIKITQGDTYSITFNGTVEDAEWLKKSVDDGEFELKGHSIFKVNITFKELEEIEVKGMSDISSTGPIRADDFSIDISGTADVTLELYAQETSVDISGAGNLTLKGTTDKLEMDISGAGNVTADEFKARICNADISGSGHCTVDVTEELNSSISGSGSVSYKNPPAKVNKDISGIGRVEDESNNSSDDTLRFNMGDKNVLVIGGKKKKKKNSGKVQPHWAGFELGINGYLTPDRTMFPKGYDFLELDLSKSVAVNLNFFDYGIRLYRRNVMLVSGLGLSYNNYRFRGDSILSNGPNGIYATGDLISYRKNKLTVSYLTVPVLLEFNTSQIAKRSFHVSAGATFGYRLGSHTKQVYSLEGKKYKPKTYDQFSINPWRVDATARIGFHNLTLFANYDMVHLFRDGKGPELHPFTAGITLVGW